MDPQLQHDSDLSTLLELFHIRVERDGGQPFLVDPDGTSFTYADLSTAAHRLGDHLQHAGVRRGDTVGLYLWNEPAWFVAVLACWSVGGVAALCGAVSPTSEAERRFDLVGPKVVIASTDAPAIQGWPTLRVAPDGEVVDATPPPPSIGHDIAPAPEDHACIFFTSGTTGDAKALVKSHASLLAAAQRTAGAYASSPSFRPRVAPPSKPPALSFHPFGHVASFGRVMFRLYVGRSVIMLRKFDTKAVGALVERHRIDTLQLTPAMVHMLAFDDGELDLSSLRYVTSGTAPLAVATRDAFEARYGVPVLQAFGSTEGGVMALERYDDVVAGRRGHGSVGRITSDSEWRIVDEAGRDVAPGSEGEILGRPKQQTLITAEGESTLPLDADGWYHTGDVGRVDEHGILYITGRIKEMLIVGGFNVFPTEIEDALRQIDSIRDVIVVPVADDRLGEVPAAGIVWEPSAHSRSEAELATEALDRVRADLASYKVPRRWFTLPSLPLTSMGKPDRRAAAAEAEARSTASEAFAAPTFEPSTATPNGST
jgi:acyl-CoA synthetase (AMP-forming)/AMP-acid ligase II